MTDLPKAAGPGVNARPPSAFLYLLCYAQFEQGTGPDTGAKTAGKSLGTALGRVPQTVTGWQKLGACSYLEGQGTPPFTDVLRRSFIGTLERKYSSS